MQKRVGLIAVGAVIAAGAVVAQMKAPAPASTPAPKVVTATQAIVTPPAAPSLESAKRIPRDEAIKLVKTGKAVFVDVRAKEAYDAGHIKGALGIPEFELINRLKEIPPGKMIITYCA
jgi:3-mercaptopyruvate sulfurtransferase SseA